MLVKSGEVQGMISGDIPMVQSLTTVGGDTQEWDTMFYTIQFKMDDGKVVKKEARTMEVITSPQEKMDLRMAARKFHVWPKEVERPSRPVDLLVGILQANIFSTDSKIKQSLRLRHSHFGSGKLFDGAHQSIKAKGCHLMNEAHAISGATTNQLRPYTTETIGAEALGACGGPRESPGDLMCFHSTYNFLEAEKRV